MYYYFKISREMCTWDLIDGQCIESVKLHQIHSLIQVIYFVHNLLKITDLPTGCI